MNDKKNIYAICSRHEHVANVVERWVSRGMKNVVLIEAEYGNIKLDLGDVTVEDIKHHGEHVQNEAPCMRWDLYDKYRWNTLYVFSHLDLDSIVATLICEARIRDSERNRKICELIAHIDNKGPHLGHLHKHWNRFQLHVLAMNNLISDFSSALKKGQGKFSDLMERLKIEISNVFDNYSYEKIEFIANKYSTSLKEICNALDAKFSEQNKIHAFVSRKPMVRNYYIENCKKFDGDSYAPVVVQYNTTFKSILLGCVDENAAREHFGDKGVLGPLTSYFGDGAGGRVSYGGSPRGIKYEYNDYLDFVKYVKRLIEARHVSEPVV